MAVLKEKSNENLLLTSSGYIKQREYWLGKLSGDIAGTGITPGGKRSRGAGKAVKQIDVVFPGELSAQLMHLSYRNVLTIYIILVAGLKALVYRYTGSEDVTVVSPVCPAAVPGKTGTANDFLFIRDAVTGGISFKELLIRVRETVLQAYENQDYPTGKLVDYMVNNSLLDSGEISGIGCLLRNIHDHRFLNDLSSGFIFSMILEENLVKGDIFYDPGVYSEGFARQVGAHYVNLVDAAARDVNVKISGIFFLSEAEKRQLLFSFNGNRADFPRDKSVHQLIRDIALQHPHRIAAVCKRTHLSFRELDERSGRLAIILKDKGIRYDDLVGILMERSVDMVVSVLAVWKAGAAYLPIDPGYPPGRIDYMLKDSNARVLLGEESGLSKVSGGIEVVQPGEPGTELPAHLTHPTHPTHPTQLCYVIYTSGSTGKPKGAVVEHKGMMNHIRAKIHDLQLTDQSIVAQNASFTFDISVWQFFSALTAGGRTVIYPDDVVLDPGYFIIRLIRDRVTVLEVVPSYLAVVLDYLEDREAPPLFLCYLLVTGEEVKPDLVGKWFGLYPHVKMVNAYGPTEAADDITHFIMDGAPAKASVPIGKPVQNFNIYIVDKDMNLCPPGVRGEICVSGIGVGRGYLNNPGRTARAFIWDPFREGKRMRLYKTGDLGCWLPDGTVEFFGRKDHQVKIRGYRIELGEIETELRGHPGIKEAVVIDKEDEQGNRYLCAYLVPAGKIEIQAVKDGLVKRLPGYMVPAYFVQLEQIPLTANGKVDRKALPEPAAGSDARMVYITAAMMEKTRYDEDEAEEELISSTAEEIDIFFRDNVGTIEEERLTLQKYPGQIGNRRNYYPLSHPQKMIYYSQKTYRGTPCENLAYLVKYPVELDRRLLEKAINRVLFRHEGLRLRIVEIEEGDVVMPAQYTADYNEHRLDYFDFSGEESEELLQTWLDRNNNEPVNMIDNDLFYFAYVKLGRRESGYYMKFHHIGGDGWTRGILVEEIDRIYRSLKEGGDVDFGPASSYISYVTNEQDYLTSSRAKRDMEFWHKKLLPLPQVADLSFKAGNSFDIKGEMRDLSIPGELRTRMHDYCKVNQTSIYKLVLAALSVCVSRVTANNDFVIGTLNHNRGLDAYKRTAGTFISFVPLRILAGGSMEFQRFVEELGRDIRVILKEHQGYPFDFLIRELREKTGVDPVYFYNINLIGHSDVKEKNCKVEYYIPGYTDTPLTIHIDYSNRDIDGILELRWVYRVDRFSGPDIGAFHDQLVNILNDALASPGKKLAKIELLAEKQKERILYEFNNREISHRGNLDIFEFVKKPLVYILSEEGMVQPVNVPGELCLGGDEIAGLPAGSPGFSKEKMISSPFLEGGMIYRTGELARWLADGSLEFLGKMDKRVFFRGRKIYPGEIEDCLLTHKDVKEAIVLVRKDKNTLNKHLVAFVTSDRELLEAEVREFLAAGLPPHLVPSYYFQLEKIPLTPGGEVDRGVLPGPGALHRGGKYAAPRDELEEKLAAIWLEILGLRVPMGIDDNFFEMGGHSLKALTMVSRIHKVLNRKVELLQIFRTPTIRGLAGFIKGTARDTFVPLEPVEAREYYSLSSAQKRIYISQQMARESTAYNISQFIVLEGELESERMEETFRNLIMRHESLRTSFPLINHEPVQWVHDEVKFSVEYSETDINIEDTGCGNEVETIMQEWVRPFDLSRAPLLRAKLIKFKEKAYLMMADVHHIVSDGLSNQIVAKDFMDLYTAQELPPLRIQYKDFSGWQNHEKRKEERREREEFWLKQFENKIPVLNLPTDYSRPAVKTFAGERIHFELEAGETGALKKLALQEETTLYTVLLAIYYILLYKISGQQDIIVGTPVAGRGHADLEPIIGMFLNTLPLRNTVDGALSFKDFLQQVKKRVLDSFQNQDYQFEELVEKVALTRDMSRNPIFDVMFSLQNFAEPEMKGPRLSLKPFKYKCITSKFDLHFRAVEAGEKLVFGVEYSTSLFKRDTISRFMVYFKKIVIEVAGHPGRELAAIKRLSRKEDHDLLARFSDNLEDE